LGFVITHPNLRANSVETISSTLWDMVFKELWRKKITKATISKELSIPLDELEKLVIFRKNSNIEKESIGDRVLTSVK
jgi:hypothetical protein